MSMHDLLQEHKNLLDDLYNEHLETVLALQDTLINDILPGLVDEFRLNPASEARAREWLQDTAFLLRHNQRDKCIVSFALESIRKTLVWRLNSLSECTNYVPCSFLRCLPHNARDPFGRPIVYMDAGAFVENPESLRHSVACTMELLRVHLRTLNDGNDAHEVPTQHILQYVALLDIKRISFQSAQHIDFISWFIYELLPRFPGMLAATFVLNYTWAHSGLWNLAKHALPASALAKVSFPRKEELLALITPSSLPPECGGTLPTLSQLDDPLRAYVPRVEDRAHSRPPSPPVLSRFAPRGSSAGSISPTSSRNPFYGYPISVRSSNLTLRHGRRRKRDLLWTLARLWWARWSTHVKAGLYLLLVILLLVLVQSARFRRWRPFRLLRLAWSSPSATSTSRVLGSAP
ncbi:hypothetical protein OBBRIDRAFT_728303 [Obba rivulosa]|uniref:CRAL-TRIO domain-containing protein n=1 Tax=Obba rivulosa TaxID=1052685 RepID=A0A8E2DMY3_9APHY|nr:hypothetical protein OBBRIDRAFT_728303 [Obba rivulosa]